MGEYREICPVCGNRWKLTRMEIAILQWALGNAENTMLNNESEFTQEDFEAIESMIRKAEAL